MFACCFLTIEAEEEAEEDEVEAKAHARDPRTGHPYHWALSVFPSHHSTPLEDQALPGTRMDGMRRVTPERRRWCWRCGNIDGEHFRDKESVNLLKALGALPLEERCRVLACSVATT